MSKRSASKSPASAPKNSKPTIYWNSRNPTYIMPFDMFSDKSESGNSPSPSAPSGQPGPISSSPLKDVAPRSPSNDALDTGAGMDDDVILKFDNAYVGSAQGPSRQMVQEPSRNIREPSDNSREPSRDTQEPSQDDQEPSDDDMVDPPPSRRSPQVPRNTFPIFPDGNVLIKMDLGATRRTYQLHRGVLGHYSPVFADAFQNEDMNGPHPSWYSFKVTYVDGSPELLHRRPTGPRPQPPHDNPQVPPGTDPRPEDAAADDDRDAENLAVYTNLLASFYGIGPTICDTHIVTARTQCEALIKLTAKFRVAPLFRPNLSLALSSYHRGLYQAIAVNPVPWLCLSLDLQNKSIYTEALTHLIGAYPCIPWVTGAANIPRLIKELIKRKAAALSRARAAVERNLLLLNIQIPNPREETTHGPNPLENREQEAWLVAQWLRDSVATRITEIEQGNQSALHWGKLYRGIHEGTPRWLQADAASRVCWEAAKLESGRDLVDGVEQLKKGAKEVVKNLARNELIYDSKGLGYLTCVNVGDEDVPWLAGGE